MQYNQDRSHEQSTHLEQAVVPPRHYHAPVEPHEGHHASTVISVFLFLAWLAMLIVGVTEAKAQIATAAIVLVYVSIPLLFILGLASLVYPIWHRWYLDKLKRDHAKLDKQAKEEQMQREQEEHQVRMYLAQTRLHADLNGNRPHIFNPVTYEVLEIASGNFPQPVPNHYAPHWHYQDTSTRPEQNLLGSGVTAPTIDFLIEQLGYNQLQVCLGVSATTGQPFKMDLIEGTHYRIIGGSGFGKSCEAAAILEQVTKSNDPEHLLIALLDLEHKTSRLFEDAPHVAELQIGRKRVECVATSPDEVAQHFRYLRDELDRRKALSEYDLQHERFMLIYVEEFLSLKREVDPELKAQMMDDFSILALRGRKYGLYLLACAQVDYSDKSLRDAMNQFNVNMSFSVKPSAARAVGFSSNELLKANFEAKQRGQFVLETTGCSDILLAPQFDVKAKLQRLGRSDVRSPLVQEPFIPPQLQIVNGSRTLLERNQNGVQNGPERPGEANREEVQRLRAMGWGKQAIIEKVWNVKKGGSPRYREAEIEYHQIITVIEAQEGEA